jgi:transposase
MRGDVKKQSSMLSLRTPAERIPSDHPLRRVKDLADGALAALSPTFEAMYSKVGRPSIPPERLLKGSLLMALYSVRSERLLCEQLDYNLLFRWFLDMDMEEPSPDHSTFSINRERLLEHEVAKRFFVAVVEQAQKGRLMSNEHFTVDGTLIEAWASLKSFRPKGEEKQKPPDDPGNPTVNFHGEKRSNETHASTTDPEARLMRKGQNQEARLSYSANALMENRNGLLVDFCIETADGYAERRSAAEMLERVAKGSRSRLTVGADKGYDSAAFVERCRQLGVTPHVAQYTNSRRRSAVDGRTARHAGYAISQRIRKRVEEIFGWMKTVGGFRKTRHRGRDRTQLAAYLVGAAYNLMRMARLRPA